MSYTQYNNAYGASSSNSYGSGGGLGGGGGFPGGSGPGYNARAVGTIEKVEESLSQHIKKALSPEETAPKQKHVRACIVYSWDLKAAGSLWTGFKLSPILGDEVMCFKAMITLHKVIRGGHPSVLKDSQNEIVFINSIAQSVQHQSSRGYGLLIKAYVQYLLAKMEFHRLNPEFNANFEYEDYLALKGTTDPNEGYQKVMDLLGLLEKLDSFQKLIFANFRPTSNNECRISALVPLVEESYGIYNFLKSMLQAMHSRVDNAGALLPLVQRFNSNHYGLVKFYYECSNLKYLTSLITVPRLPQDPPSFVASGNERFTRETFQYVQTTMTLKTRDLVLNQSEFELQHQMMEAERLRRMQEESERQRRLEEERMRMMMEQQQQHQLSQQAQMAMQRINELERELIDSRERERRERETAETFERRMKALESQLSSMQLQRESGDSKDEMIRRLQDELNQWKQKYEALAKLYAQLRKEHLELLNKLKDLKDIEAKVRDETNKELEKMRAELRTKNTEWSDALRERDRLKAELDRLQTSHTGELARLKRELENARLELESMGRSKGADLEDVVKRFNREKSELEDEAKRKQDTIDALRRQLDEAMADLNRAKSGREEETAVLQSGMDQSLMALAQLQKNARDTEGNLLSQIDKMNGDHSAQLAKIMDNILESCSSKMDEAIHDLESPNHPGNATATPEFVLTMVEKASTASADLANSFVGLVQGGEYTDPIHHANLFAAAMTQVLHNAKGVTRLSGSDDTTDKIIDTARQTANSSKFYFQNLKSNILNPLPPSSKPPHIHNLNSQVKGTLGAIGSTVDTMVVKDINMLEAREEEMGDIVEREMMAASRAIEDAARRLAAITSKPTASTTELNVHRAILDAAMAMTNAISNLIKYATLTQQEIVAHGKGSSTKGAFYKKNNRWTEGLISAAKAVAVATNILVECADGVVNGTHSLEQLVVAATEVSAATTQLVAASRVNAVPGSKTQDKLEMASSAVREAVKMLVKAAKDASKQNADSRIMEDLKSMKPHEYKVKEMEQQVKILELEQSLGVARSKLGEMRRRGYKDGDTGLEGAV